MDVIEAIKKRRTHRQFENKAIPENILMAILEAGYSAPTNDHLRNWEVIIIDKKDERRKLIEKVNKNRTKEKAIETVNNSNMKNVDQKNMYIEAIPLQYNMLIQSGILIIPFYYQEKDLLKAKELSDLNYFASIWCFIENILIAASAYGIMGVTRIPTEEERKYVKEIVRAPDHYEFPCYLSLGYPKSNENKIKQVDIDIKKHIHKGRW